MIVYVLQWKGVDVFDDVVCVVGYWVVCYFSMVMLLGLMVDVWMCWLIVEYDIEIVWFGVVVLLVLLVLCVWLVGVSWVLVSMYGYEVGWLMFLVV